MGVAEKTDAELQEDVLAEFDWDPEVGTPGDIGVEVTQAVVTITGVVRHWAERDGAERAARRTPGVTQVVNKIEVQQEGSPTHPKADSSEQSTAAIQSPKEPTPPTDAFDPIIEASWESFPASDAPAWVAGDHSGDDDLATPS